MTVQPMRNLRVEFQPRNRFANGLIYRTFYRCCALKAEHYLSRSRPLADCHSASYGLGLRRVPSTPARPLPFGICITVVSELPSEWLNRSLERIVHGVDERAEGLEGNEAHPLVKPNGPGVGVGHG